MAAISLLTGLDASRLAEFQREAGCEGKIATIPFHRFWPSEKVAPVVDSGDSGDSGARRRVEPSRITHVGLDVKMEAEEEESREFALCVAWVEPYREPAAAPAQGGGV